MSRSDRWTAAVVALVAGGCMRIYPDPELPDIQIEWSPDFECRDATDRVVVSLTAVDPAAEIGTVTVPCRDAGVRFDDVARVRYHLAAKLEDTAGAVLGAQDDELDLRDGLSERIYTFFGRAPESNFRVAWTFDMGATCASLSATVVVMRAELTGGGPTFYFDAPCDAPVFENAIPLDGTYTLVSRAIATDTVVATAPESAPFTIARGTLNDLGTITLSPCGAACPPIGSE